MSAARAGQSLIAGLGGEAGIAAIIDEFSARVLADAGLDYLFAGIEPGRLRQHHAAILACALSSPDTAQQRDMRRSHQGLGINAAQFAVTIGHLGAALAHCGVPPQAATAVIAAVAACQRAVVGT